METITASQAQSIIDIACSTWKERLASLWGTNIVLDKDIEITKENYLEMRKACTKQQNELFDTIFGEETTIDFSILNNTDIFYLKAVGFKYLFKGKDPFSRKPGVKIYSYYNERVETNKLCDKEAVKELRKATPEEIALYCQKVYNIKDGDLVWIKTCHGYELRYTNGVVNSIGSVQCYSGQRKEGGTITWEEWQLAKGIEFPNF